MAGMETQKPLETMKPPLRFSMPNCLRPILTSPQFNFLMSVPPRGWEYIKGNETIARNLELKNYGRIEGHKFHISAEGKSAIAKP